MSALPALRWARCLDRSVTRTTTTGSTRRPQDPGAEMETSRGCPYHCTFCAKDNFRNDYRKRPLDVILEELDGLIAQGVEYVYFIDEIFLPNRELLEALVDAAGDLRRADPHRPVEPRPCSTCSARPAASRSRPGSRASPKKGANLLDKQSRLTTDEICAAAGPRPRARAVRPGQPDRCAGRRPGRGRSVAAAPAAARRLGQQAGAAVPVSGLARLHAALGPARRAGLGARARALPRQPRRLQRHPGRASAPARPNWSCQAPMHGGEAMPPRPDDGRRGRRRLGLRAASSPQALGTRGVRGDARHDGRTAAAEQRAAARGARRRYASSRATTGSSGWTTRGTTSRGRASGCWSSRRSAARTSSTSTATRTARSLERTDGGGRAFVRAARGGGGPRRATRPPTWDGYRRARARRAPRGAR